MPFYCTLCANEDESCYWGNFCSKCLKLKKIIDLYGIDNINESLETIYIRDKEKIENRSKLLAKESIKTRSMAKKSVA